MNHEVILFTIGCPACKVLAKKLIMKDIPYQICTDKAVFQHFNIEVFPMMMVDGNLLSYGEAVNWVNNQEVSDSGSN